MTNRMCHTQISTGKVYIHRISEMCDVCDGIFPGNKWCHSAVVKKARHAKPWWRFW